VFADNGVLFADFRGGHTFYDTFADIVELEEVFVFDGTLLDFDVEIIGVLGEDGADTVDLRGLLETGCEFYECVEEIF
jgi:hypothetical protein